MKNKQTYKKGDKVWVQIPTAGNNPTKHLALILAVLLTPTHYNRELHFAVRYLDNTGTAAYQCIPESWIEGLANDEQVNNVRTTIYH